MKIYIVNHTHGDYIGWFENDVIGAFVNKDLAHKVANETRENNKNLYGKVTVDEVEVTTILCDDCGRYIYE